MRFRVLGCSGGELPHHRTTCFLVDGRLAIDAGALTSSLSLPKLLKVDDVVLTHSHFDHIKDVPLLADLLVGRRTRPVRVHASTECARTLRQNVFNGKLWPDFTRIPSPGAPVMDLRSFSTRRAFRAGALTFQPVPVRHPVESVGFVVGDGRTSFGISGDTGPTTAFWKLVNGSPGLKALLVELSFPNELQRLGRPLRPPHAAQPGQGAGQARSGRPADPPLPPQARLPGEAAPRGGRPRPPQRADPGSRRHLQVLSPASRSGQGRPRDPQDGDLDAPGRAAGLPSQFPEPRSWV